jgi:hypothetical protein
MTGGGGRAASASGGEDRAQRQETEVGSGDRRHAPPCHGKP